MWSLRSPAEASQFWEVWFASGAAHPVQYHAVLSPQPLPFVPPLPNAAYSGNLPYCMQEEFGHLKAAGDGVATGSAAEHDERGGAGVT